MAFWVRGGGEQTFGPSHGEGKKRPYYYVDDETDEPGHRPLQRRAIEDDNSDDREIRRQHHFMSSLDGVPPQYQVQTVYRQHIQECDIPYESIEPRDATPVEEHVFLVLYEESPNMARSISSQSPLPIPAGQSPLLLPTRWENEHSTSPAPVATNWKNGSDLKAYGTRQPLYSSELVPVHAPRPKLLRYEDWRDQNRRYDSAPEPADLSRSDSPFVEKPHAYSQRQTPDDTGPRVYAHSLGDRWMARPDIREAEVVYDFDYERNSNISQHEHHHPAGPQHEHQMVQSLSCTIHDPSKPAEIPLMTDTEAAASVTAHLASFNRRFPSSRHERILLGLIHPKSAKADFKLDDSALQSIFSSANEIFFNGRLTQRVQWDWSDENSNPQYDNKIIGHTSLRRAQIGGFETFVLLSTPILKSREYSRRLLISAFLHELIHCYLFICCGWSARESGGHTEGFRRIADTIDQWAGRENLFLCQVEADLEQFRQLPERNAAEDDEVEDYSGYSVASPVFYNAQLCPTSSNGDWERRLHDCWDHHQHHHGSIQTNSSPWP